MSNYYELFPTDWPLHDTKTPQTLTSEPTRIIEKQKLLPVMSVPYCYMELDQNT